MVGKIQFIQVIQGVFWVEINDLDLRILCSCPPDVVKHLMLKGLIKEIKKDGFSFESGPNVILLSDIMLQNGQFSNMAEFPVLQMLYKQGMIIPNHPNNNGCKPLLIGSKEQIKSQMDYIYRGNYGLVTYEEILENVKDETLAKDLWRMKQRFAFGRIKPTEELLDTIIIEDEAIVLKDKLTIKRTGTNIFEFIYDDENLEIDINLSRNMSYCAPYPLGFHDIKREYFSVIHSGQGDGFDVNRPSMSSIITFQGKIYIIDAGPNISYSLTTLGFGINEIEGIFQTHAHDDHFAGITTLLRSDHRIKFFATPMVRSSVFKKLSVLLGKNENDFSDFFDIHDLKMDKWNDVHGLEVRPVMSPHPVETTVFFFQTFWGGEYSSYAHLADIASLDILKSMIVEDDEAMGISQKTYDKVTSEYLTQVNLKKIDIGGGMIHGNAEDFSSDETDRIILAHTASPLTTRQKEIGSSAPFGIVDVMIPEFTNNLHRKAFTYLQNYFNNSSQAQLEKIVNNAIILYPPGSLILKSGEKNSNVYLLLTGYVEKMTSSNNGYNLLSSGSFIGDYSGLREIKSTSTFRSVSYVQTLQIPSKSYKEFIKKNRLFRKIEELRENLDYLEQHWLFKESIGAAILGKISANMVQQHYYHANDFLPQPEEKTLYLLKSGKLEITYQGRPPLELSPGEFFHYEDIINEAIPEIRVRVLEPSSIFEINHASLKDIPIVLWKLIETYNKARLNIKKWIYRT